MRLILLDRTGYAPRDAFTVAHEVMHFHCPEWILPEQVEAWCDRGAAALLLPRCQFLAALQQHGLDVPRLRRKTPASYKTIGRRIIDLVPGSELSMWENGAPFLESCHAGSEPSHAASVAHSLAVSEAMGRGHAEVSHAGVRASAWRFTGVKMRRAIVVSLA